MQMNANSSNLTKLLDNFWRQRCQSGRGGRNVSAFVSQENFWINHFWSDGLLQKSQLQCCLSILNAWLNKKELSPFVLGLIILILQGAKDVHFLFSFLNKFGLGQRVAGTKLIPLNKDPSYSLPFCPFASHIVYGIFLSLRTQIIFYRNKRNFRLQTLTNSNLHLIEFCLTTRPTL